MILQRRCPIRIWGESEEGETAEVRINGRPVTKQALTAGEFSFFIPPQEAAESVTLEIGDYTFSNVDIGEVWLAGGQSNMEYELSADLEGEDTIQKADDPHFRMYTVARYSYEGEEQNCRMPEDSWNRWISFQPENCGRFSAVAVFFALELRKLGVPIGIISCNWGGTTAAAWLDPACLERNELTIYLREYEEKLKSLDMVAYMEKNCLIRRGRGTLESKELEKAYPAIRKEAFVMGPCHENRPGGLYETMVKKVAGYTLKGIIWYQGESDDRRYALYADLFRSVIDCWRRDWQKELPFLFVQLAPFGRWEGLCGKYYPMMRKQQEAVCSSCSDTYMISAGDAGDEWDIHPRRKRPIGYRLGIMARNKVYGETGILCDAPKLIGVQREKGRILLLFTGAEGLHIAGSCLNALEITDKQGKRTAYTASVSDDRLVLESCMLAGDRHYEISFAQTGYYCINLLNAQQIPAFPFDITV